jgi:ComF family protein
VTIAHIIPHLRSGALTATWQGARRRWRGLLARVGSICPACEGAARGGLLCAACLEAVSVQTARRRCPRCALRLSASRAAQHGGLCVECALFPPAFARAVAAFDYDDPFDELIARYKGARRYAVAGALAQVLERAVRADGAARGASSLPVPACRPVDALVPVPASRASLRQRGFNPAGELARALARRMETRLLRGALRRRHETDARQASLSRPEREAAALDLYVCTRPLAGLHIALVDDVMTTGSTADAAARALLAAGAVEVSVWVAARTPRPV